ncbi:MAG: site-specific integrase [Paludibacter sp.]|nr:site-specific integrase [Bacteroidales bacterium]MCM1068374.1 site-specific integrase [Prevotella sp.]MCM1354523.1 site-specific integrase [Bacteroides sp.]MCM1443440.1 site-specific integrase [Muribaculum sp.]MCM1482659.1 site-specific integrase [Paludibacter sp.]
MASVKVKFRLYSANAKDGTIYYQIIHKRVIRRIKTNFRILVDEWDERNGIVIIPTDGRSPILQSIRACIDRDIKRLNTVISKLHGSGDEFTANDIIEGFHESVNELSFSQFMQSVIIQLKGLNRVRTAETYATTLNSFMRFRKDNDVLLNEINSDLMMEYEAYLKAQGVTMNTVSFYMRILRAVYNRAVEKGLTEQCTPFRHVYTGIDKTVKRAISLKAIKRIKELDLSLKPSLDFAKDMFLFSFYTRGMSFIDMAYLRKTDLQNGILSYRRRKTGQQLFIKWEKCMQDIIDKYEIESTCPYLLPILTYPYERNRKQYKNTLFRVNKCLKEVARLANIEIPLTMYVSRHSWASAAKNKNIPVAVISESMGHDSEKTTLIYLASLDCSVIDKANLLILKSL